ncbi:MAG: hypothetical protein ACXVWW_07025 [Nocardioides sp.]
MTQAQSNGYSDEQLEAIQAVVDRVTSWQDGATEGTVVEELRRGLDEVGVQVGESDVARLADAIEARHGAISAAQILGG